MSELVQVIYSSISKTLLSVQELEKILHSSRENNTKNNITGILLYNKRSFIQVLEGPRAAVYATLNKIKQDPRHKDLMVLIENIIIERDFPNWAMGFRGVEENDAEGLSDFLHPFRSADEKGISEGVAKSLINRFRDINKR